ncbi:hypothetical protein EVAR_7679_1 [Eumeta japonica]|uniref:Uncharacterized protein n=1 Tax=Eumeta variegata TaxID=151549 RepID=A0A4C1TLJ4_EUMVA|nr:hypothetical protein EVAR_7679_1 [Eumeta japonica]
MSRGMSPRQHAVTKRVTRPSETNFRSQIGFVVDAARRGGAGACGDARAAAAAPSCVLLFTYFTGRPEPKASLTSDIKCDTWHFMHYVH